MSPEGIENFRFNVCVAKLYELTNSISKLNQNSNTESGIKILWITNISTASFTICPPPC